MRLERSRRETILRVAVISLLVAAPLARACGPILFFNALLILCSTIGLLAIAFMRDKNELLRFSGILPLTLFGALIAFQIVPLPPSLLRLISPGSYAFRDDISLVPTAKWLPISVSPFDTARGLAAFAAYVLFYIGVHALFGDIRWKRRLFNSVMLTGFAMTLIGLIQAASPYPRRLYGIFRLDIDWAVFGPYANRNHFANYVVMAVMLSFGAILESSEAFRQAWRRRRPPWLALGDAEGTRLLRLMALSMTLLVGLVVCGSRGGVLGFVAGLVVFSLVYHSGRLVLGVAILVVTVALSFVDLTPILQSFQSRGAMDRIALWIDLLHMFPHFPLFGSGFNAFIDGYSRYQSVNRNLGGVNAAHNEYLQILIDTGLLGTLLALAAFFVLFRRAFSSARKAPFEAGVFVALAAFCAHNMVEFNWQVPANALTFAALAGVVLAPCPAPPNSIPRLASRRRKHRSETLDA